MARKNRSGRFAGTLVAALLMAASASAGDGVLEINQACAVNGGCFPGDGGGFPVTITTTSGGTSFLLTSDLYPTDRNADAIRVVLNDATIDLNGFLIFFSNGQAGPGRGVNAELSIRTTVKNGSIYQAGSEGVFMGNHGRAEDLIIESVGGTGIFAGGESIVVNNRVSRPGSHGIQTRSGSRVEKNFVVFSGQAGGGDGILVREGSFVLDNMVRFPSGNCIWGEEDGQQNNAAMLIIERNVCADAGGSGIAVGASSSVTRNVVRTTAGVGVVALQGASISDNNITGNGSNGILSFGGHVSGNVSNDNTLAGIRVSNGTLVERNIMTGNATYGLRVTLADSFRANNIYNNNSTVGGGGANAGGNICNGSASCP